MNSGPRAEHISGPNHFIVYNAALSNLIEANLQSIAKLTVV